MCSRERTETPFFLAQCQAVWCALYKQSGGDDAAAGEGGWEVLGMINNYQKDLLKDGGGERENSNSAESGGGGVAADRDSGALTVIASLERGDKVWVEWRGYGQSFLYSNPYRLITFTGYLVAKS